MTADSTGRRVLLGRSKRRVGKPRHARNYLSFTVIFYRRTTDPGRVSLVSKSIAELDTRTMAEMSDASVIYREPKLGKGGENRQILIFRKKLILSNTSTPNLKLTRIEITGIPYIFTNTF